MVVAFREQQPKKSNLSLFRLVKPCSNKSTSHTPPSQHPPLYASQSYPSSSNAQISRREIPPPSKTQIVTSTRQAANQAANQAAQAIIPVHYQYPEASNFTGNYHWSSASESKLKQNSENEVEQDHCRTGADLLPLESLFHSTEAIHSGQPNLPALSRLQTHMAPSRQHHHSRQRSHFSIPDVIVTTCESEGEQEMVELSIPPNKRRYYVLRDSAESHPQEQRSNKKTSSTGFVRRPAPLISFNAQEIRTVGMMPRSGSLGSIASANNSPISPTSPSSIASTPTSSASSTLSKASGSTPKNPSRKSSFPLLFGKKSLHSSRSSSVLVEQTYVDEPLPLSPITSGSTITTQQPDGLLFSSHNSSPTSAPPSSSRGIFTRAISGLPSPPITPTSSSSASTSSHSLSKKQLKAKAKQELALIKELERVDKLVKQHDVKARKLREKEEAKERKRMAKLRQANQELHRPQSQMTSQSVDTYNSTRSGRTVFQAATKASGGGGGGSGSLARRTSIRGGVGEVRAEGFVGKRRGSEPVLSQQSSMTGGRVHVSTPYSMDLPAGERTAFSEPRAAPKPNFPPPSPSSLSYSQQPYQGSVRESSSKDQTRFAQSSSAKETSPPRPNRSAPRIPPLNIVRNASIEAGSDRVETASLTHDRDEAPGVFHLQSWSELNSGFISGPLPSLVHPSTSSNYTGSTTRRNEIGQEGDDEVLELDESGQHQDRVKITRRASIQRILALSDADKEAKRMSLIMTRKRTSQQYLLKRRSSHITDTSMDALANMNESRGGHSTKKSSLTSDGKRRSLIRSVSENQGWTVVVDDDHDGDELAKVDDSIIAQANTSLMGADGKWEDEDGVQDSHPEQMEVEVDAVLADLGAAQQAYQIPAISGFVCR
uniref:Uncharacterized protein n=1 Tax=Melanopsichium pennsylvanicum 4 TaxID=1398559 RepID=A0A077R7A9_9BASI|nr:hypothetical protein BN887_03067 [Melanopsichium pennsylvanicum 4]